MSDVGDDAGEDDEAALPMKPSRPPPAAVPMNELRLDVTVRSEMDGSDGEAHEDEEEELFEICCGGSSAVLCDTDRVGRMGLLI